MVAYCRLVPSPAKPEPVEDPELNLSPGKDYFALREPDGSFRVVEVLDRLVANDILRLANGKIVRLLAVGRLKNQEPL